MICWLSNRIKEVLGVVELVLRRRKAAFSHPSSYAQAYKPPISFAIRFFFHANDSLKH